MSMRVKGDGKPGAATSGTPGLGGRVQATCLPQGRMTRCALTSSILASAISRKQDTEAFFAVFYDAVRHFGVPEVLVSDNGSVFTSHETRWTCELLGIEKKEIKKGRPYQNWGLSTVGTKSRNSLLNWPGEGTEEAFLYRRKKQF